MIIFKVKDLLEKNDISRYKLQKLTNWNYKRINAYYKGEVVNITIEELDKLCEIFKCKIADIVEYKK